MRRFIISGLTALSLFVAFAFVTGLADAVPARAFQVTDVWDFQSGDTHIQHGGNVKGSVSDLLAIFGQ
jgi:hypothetical protein